MAPAVAARAGGESHSSLRARGSLGHGRLRGGALLLADVGSVGCTWDAGRFVCLVDAVPVEVVVEAAMVTETVEFTMNSTKVRQFSAVSTAPDFSNADAG